MPHPYASLCQRLKGTCVEYVTQHLFEDFKVSSVGKGFFEEYLRDDVIVGDQEDIEEDWVLYLDSFILFGKTKDDAPVLEVIRENANLSKEEKDILKEWQGRAFTSAFEILDIQDDKFCVLDVVSEAKLDVYSNNQESILRLFPNISQGQFIFSNLLSIKGDWFLSGGQKVLPASEERYVYENVVQKQHPHKYYRNNPEKLALAFAMQKKQYDVFVKHFGTDELFLRGDELKEKQREFYRAYSQSKGKELPDSFDIAGEGGWDDKADIGMVIDEKEGIHFFLDYRKFVETFDTPPEDTKPSALRRVRGYLEDDTMPAFVFRKIKDRNPEGFRNVINNIIDLSKEKKGFDPVQNFEYLMDAYKPGWREVYPSVHPMNERFKKFTYQALKVGRNDPCPCQSGKKFKKCCGR